jgi:hypothetical protein
MTARSQSAATWGTILRRQDESAATLQPDDARRYEVICTECGDDPDRAYPDVPAEFQLIRGPYVLGAAISAYEQHLEMHERSST